MKTLNLLAAMMVLVMLIFASCQENHESNLEETSTLISSKTSYSSTVNSLVAQLRNATRQYHNPQVAIDSGYFNTQDCIEGPPGEGAMGVHFVKFGLVDDIFEPLKPEVLVYEIRNNGTYKLVAVEYLYIGANAPYFGGEVEFEPAPVPFADYALHAWIWKANPAGLFADWNINVTCP